MRIQWVFLLFFVVSVSSAACLDFYHVKRPVAYGAVYHEYIGVKDEETGKSEVFGLLKGPEDLVFFAQLVGNLEERNTSLIFLGSACHENGERAVGQARAYAKEWDTFYDNTLLFYARMGVTPLVGKPCRNVALEIASQLQKYLH